VLFIYLLVFTCEQNIDSSVTVVQLYTIVHVLLIGAKSSKKHAHQEL